MEGVRDELRPLCHSIGTVGDLYGLIGGVASTLETAGLKSQAEEFVGRAVLSGRYDEVLELSRDYVVFDDLSIKDQFPQSGGGPNEPASE